MTTKAATKETWKDWLPDDAPEPDALYTRDQILELLNNRPVAGSAPVGVNEIRYWEQLGILPRPVRRWHEGATRALYPRWYAWLTQRVRVLQMAGFALEQIRPRIRAHARLLLGHDTPGHEQPRARQPEDIMLWPALIEELTRLAREWSALTGVPSERVEAHVIGCDGTANRYPYPIAFEDDDPPTDGDSQ